MRAFHEATRNSADVWQHVTVSAETPWSAVLERAREQKYPRLVVVQHVESPKSLVASAADLRELQCALKAKGCTLVRATTLRDAAARAASAAFYNRAPRAKFGRWVQEHATNGMTTFLVHNRMRRRRHNRTVALADADFERALAALAEFDVVGRTEQLDEFLRAVAVRMRWTPPAATAAANPTPRAQRHDLSAEERAWVHNRTALDAELVSSLCEERGCPLRAHARDVPCASGAPSRRRLRAMPPEDAPLMLSDTGRRADATVYAARADAAKLPFAVGRDAVLSRAAVVSCLCNGRDYQRRPGTVQLRRLRGLACSLRAAQSEMPLVALSHGFEASALDPLLREGVVSRIVDVSHVAPSRFALRPLFEYSRAAWGRRFPRVAGGVQRRSDYACTSLKLLAWNLTEYDKILMADTDVFFMEDPLPWLRRQWHLTFAATNELMNVQEMADEGRVSARGYHGLNTHLVLLTPSTVVLELLLDLATTGSFVPYTNSEQDVIETLFASNRVHAPLPAHWHTPRIREAACEPVRGVSGAPAEVERRALAACNATCRRLS